MKIEPYTGLTLSENQLKVLRALSEHYEEDANCIPFKMLAEETKLEYRLVRHACRALARKGLTELVRGIFFFGGPKDGQLAGSAYACTRAGYDVIERMDGHYQSIEEAKSL